MSKLYDLLSAMCGKIKKPDWNQNDPTAPDYVKNRPFYTSDPVKTVLFDATVKTECDVPVEIAIGSKYMVTLDGVEYSLTALEDADGFAFIGSETIWYGDDYIDTEPPFCLGDGWFYTVNAGDTHTLKVSSELPEIHKIDSKYLPAFVETLGNTNAFFINLDAMEFGGAWYTEGVDTAPMTLERWVALCSCAANPNKMVTGDSTALYAIHYNEQNNELAMYKTDMYIVDNAIRLVEGRKILTYDAEQKMCTCTFSSEAVRVDGRSE